MTLLQDLIHVALPELILMTVGSLLFLVGISRRLAMRKLAPMAALAALVGVFLLQLFHDPNLGTPLTDSTGSFRVSEFSQYVKLLSAGVGVLLVLLSWPTDTDAAGNPAMNLGGETGEYFALLLLSISGIFLVAGADDLVLLFLGIELASIPTYIMVSTSRNIPAAQEAGVKYFFLGAMAAAILLFGFSFLYGVTGTTNLTRILESFRGTGEMLPGAIVTLNSWQLLGAIMVILGLAFKIAAVPLHFYVGDVYQGAATPVTALLSFVPKTSGFVALIKILFVISGGSWGLPVEIAKLLWILAVLTMTAGNVLGLMQTSVKRVFAYSSIAHTGYMLVGLTTLAYGAKGADVQEPALQGVLFYLAAYGVMNAAAFGVLILLPSKSRLPATSAETFEDLAGQGRRHFSIGLAMALACFSLTGLPLTVGFLGKVYLVRPALNGENYWLVIIMMLNAAMSAGYYLKIIGTLFIPAEHVTHHHELDPVVPHGVFPILLAVALSAAATLVFGALPQGSQLLSNRVDAATKLDAQFRYTPPPETVGGGGVGDDEVNAVLRWVGQKSNGVTSGTAVRHDPQAGHGGTVHRRTTRGGTARRSRRLGMAGGRWGRGRITRRRASRRRTQPGGRNP